MNSSPPLSQFPPVQKPRFPRADALAVAAEICRSLKPFCAMVPGAPLGSPGMGTPEVRLIVAGSLRRRKQTVGDIEILYIPRFDTRPPTGQPDFFNAAKPEFDNLADRVLNSLQSTGIIQPRKFINRGPDRHGHAVWGEKNKFAYHVTTGIPIDFFQATEANWWNYLVCRTGPAENNVRIAAAYQALGCKWNPYGPGFTNQTGTVIRNQSESTVFTNAGLEYKEPWER